MGNSIFFLLDQDPKAPWKTLFFFFLWEDFKHALKSKPKLGRFWSCSSYCFTKCYVASNLFIFCLSILPPRCCLNEDKSRMPSEEEELHSAPVP